jgi:hypothetical protein
MNEIEQKALALVNEVRKERRLGCYFSVSRETSPDDEALCRAIEQHEAFEQEVSDAITYIKAPYPTLPTNHDRFIIPKPKPDPLEEVLLEIDRAIMWADICAEEIRASLESRGFEIREKGQ